MSDGWFIIANPCSNSGKTAGLIDLVKDRLESNSISYQIRATKYSGDEISIVEEATLAGYYKILTIGGDGTVQKVVAGITIQKNIPTKKIIFGLIPSGTGNDWAKSKKIPSDVSKAVDVLINGSINEQDVGVAKIVGKSGIKIRYFVTYSGVGFDSFMLKKIEGYKWFGKFSYLVCAIMNFVKYKNIPLKLITSKTEIEAEVFLLGIGICKYTGGGMRLIKNPKGNDGLLNITIAQEFSKFDIIRNFFNLFNGSIFKQRKVLTLLDSSAKICAKNGDLVCQGDGEIFGVGKIEYSVIKQGLRYLS